MKVAIKEGTKLLAICSIGARPLAFSKVPVVTSDVTMGKPCTTEGISGLVRYFRVGCVISALAAQGQRRCQTRSITAPVPFVQILPDDVGMNERGARHVSTTTETTKPIRDVEAAVQKQQKLLSQRVTSQR